MRYPASETAAKHERILEAAARLFRERGFGGAGVAEIMKAAGLTHGAFYAHFPSKEALAAAAVEAASDQTERRLVAATADVADPVQAFLDVYLSTAHRDRPGDGCALAALGPEIARDPATRAPLTAHVRRAIAALADRIGGAKAERAQQQATVVLAASVGALILSRAVDDEALSDEILTTVRETLFKH